MFANSGHLDDDVDVQTFLHCLASPNNVMEAGAGIAEGPLMTSTRCSLPRYGSKMGIDATRKTRRKHDARLAREISMSEDIKKSLTVVKEYGFD